MTVNIKLQLAYDGTRYLGWQKTSMGLSIEGQLMHALAAILHYSPTLQAASRTDAGVHAEGQEVNFIAQAPPDDLGALHYGLNALLPNDIAVRSVAIMPQPFHPTIDCLEKEYRYSVCFDTVLLPHRRCYCWHVPYDDPDIAAAQRAAAYFIGEHDFTAFCGIRKNKGYASYVRKLYALTCHRYNEQEYCFTLRGNSFLYKMVRIIVGTLVYVATGRLAAETIPAILASRQRALAGITAPAYGLTLQRVRYPMHVLGAVKTTKACQQISV